jgi:uncharacterized membrane protein YfcA
VTDITDWIAPAFAGVPPTAIAFLVAVYFLSFFVRGAFGFGSGVPAVLFGSLILGPHHAVVLSLCCAAISHAQFIVHGLRYADWGVARFVLLFLVPGVVGGVWVFRELDADWLTLLLGVIITTIVALSFTDVMHRIGKSTDIRAPWIVSALASLSGLIAGTTGAGGMYLLAAYLRHACPTAIKLRATGFTVSTVSIVGRAGVMAVAGLITPATIVETALLSPCVILGGWAGARFFRALPGQRFDQAFRAFLLIVSLIIVAKGISRIL